MDADTRQAYANTFGLLSRLFGQGPTPELRAHLEALPDLSDCLDLEDAGARHFDLFGHNIHPYQGVFLHPDAGLDGPRTDQLLRDYLTAEFAPSSGERPDHISSLLACLQQLLLPTQPSTFQPANVQQFLDQHLLPWSAPLTLAIRYHDIPCYIALSQLTFDLLAALRAEFPSEPSPPELPPQKAPLSDPRTGLKKIASHLLVPAATGLYFSPRAIQDLARAQKLPRGFGGRLQMLTNLLRNAAQYDLLGEVLDQIEIHGQKWVSGYEDLTARQPYLAPFIEPWQTRTQQTMSMVRQMKETMGRAP